MVKKKDNSKIYFGLFIAFLMISSTVGFMYGSGAETKKVNGYKFTKVDGGWQTYIKEIESYWLFTYLPDEINFNTDFYEFNPEHRIKFQACLEQGIEFCTIDVSQFSYFKPQKAEKYLKIIIEIIDRNI